MVENRDTGISPGLISGKLEGISIPDLIWTLCRMQVTGVLKLTREMICKTVYIQNGRIVFAASSDPDDRLGELFLREGMISLVQLEEAICQIGSGKRLGTILVESGYLSPENLVKGVLLQVRNTVLALFSWEDGEYRFEEGDLPTKEVITLGMKTGELLIQGIRGIRSFTRIRRSVGALRARYVLSEDWREKLDGLNLTDGEEAILARLEGEGESIDNLCRGLYISNFEIYQALWAFKVLGAISVDEQPSHSASEAVLEGALGPEGVAPLLVQLGRAGETGVLCVNRGALERTFHLKEGRCVFATSNSIDDGLLAYLLRRGVISFQDREETARRLLSNKRVGTILLEMGVIDEDDLRTMVREHLLEIIYGTMLWDQGEFTFMAGELPTIEEITLESTMEDLVSEGMLRIHSWSRVRQGCGGLESRQTLSPRFLEVLDRMRVGSQEWEIITSLKTPKTVMELCNSSDLGDYRICQILWIFRLLGVTESAGETSEAGEVETVAEMATPDLEEIPAGEPVVEESIEISVESTEDVEESLDIPVEDEGWEEDVHEHDVEAFFEEPVAVDSAEDAEESLDIPVEDESWEEDVHEHDVEALFEEPAAVEEEEREERPEIPVEEWPREDVAAGNEDGETDVEAAAEDSDEIEWLEEVEGEDTTGVFSRSEVDGWIEGRTNVENEPEEESSIAGPDTVPEPDDGDSLLPLLVEGSCDPDPDAMDQPEVEDAEDEPVTAKLDRDEVEASLEDDDDGEESAGEYREREFWEPPRDLEDQISRLNNKQRVLFRSIRAEVGAGAVNFVRSCCGRICSGERDPFSEVEMRADGSWDAEGLRRAVLEQQISDPGSEYSRLIETELEMLHLHIGDVRVRSLREQVDQVDNSDSIR